jgi:hypothetical protein
MTNLTKINKWYENMGVEYDPDTGWFTRNGERAGSLYSNGYRHIYIGGKRYKEHRLAFLFMTGEMPEQVDHINRNRSDNRWHNLRPVTSRQNMENSIINNEFVGVWWRKERNRWTAWTSGENGAKRKLLGSFKTHLTACYCRWAYDNA